MMTFGRLQVACDNNVPGGEGVDAWYVLLSPMCCERYIHEPACEHRLLSSNLKAVAALLAWEISLLAG